MLISIKLSHFYLHIWSRSRWFRILNYPIQTQYFALFFLETQKKNLVLSLCLYTFFSWSAIAENLFFSFFFSDFLILLIPQLFLCTWSPSKYFHFYSSFCFTLKETLKNGFIQSFIIITSSFVFFLESLMKYATKHFWFVFFISI